MALAAAESRGVIYIIIWHFGFGSERAQDGLQPVITWNS